MLSFLKNIFLFRRDLQFDRPIFILAPPRSGSTLLFESMFKFENLVHFDHEADPLWWELFPYDKMRNPSDYVGYDLISTENIEAVRQYILSALFRNRTHDKTGFELTKYKNQDSMSRYLDKTIANCFHLPFLDKAFPTAQYIFLVRDPRANISSMIEGWPFIERFGKPQLSRFIQASSTSTISHWSYPAPPGWQEMITKPLVEICAWSWRQHIEHAYNFLNNNSKSHIVIRYEDLIDQPIESFHKIAKHLGLKTTENLLSYVVDPKLSFTTVSNPEKDKWKRLHYEEISSVLPAIKQVANNIGYLCLDAE